MNALKNLTKELKELALGVIADCTFEKEAAYFGACAKTTLLLPSGDEKYYSFWVRDAVMMAESGLVPDSELKKYLEIFAAYAQNGCDEIKLENGLTVPPFAVADHVNYDGRPVFFPGTYSSSSNQGDGSFGFYPPFCDNFYFVMLAGYYVKQSRDISVLDKLYGSYTLLQRLEYAFACYNIDNESELCVSDEEKFTVDWGFVDTVKKSGKLLMASLLRYSAALELSRIFSILKNEEKSKYYLLKSEKIKSNIISTFYDEKSGWFYSATGLCHQYDVWATAYAVYLGVATEKRTLAALYEAYKSRTSSVCGYVRHILTDTDYSKNSAWQSTITKYGEYQNGAYWATPTGWYAYAIYKYCGEIDILKEFSEHTKKYLAKGAPFEWIDAETKSYSGLRYGTSAVLPYIAANRILKKSQEK